MTRSLVLHPLLKKYFPYQSRFLTIDGAKVHYIDEGQGPVVLLLHGNPTWCFFYRNLIERLKKNFRVLAMDFIGCGLSEHPRTRRFRATDRVAHVESFLEQLEIHRFSLVMHDWGGPIGTAMAVKRPQDIERLVYLNTTLTETEALPGIIKRAAHPVIGKFLTKYTRRFVNLTTGLGAATKIPRDIRKVYALPYKKVRDRGAVWDFVDDIPFDSSHPTYSEMMSIAEKLPRFADTPVRIVWGLRDPCFHREMLSRVADHFPHADILELPEASHLVLEDAPEAAGAAIESFLLGCTESAQAEVREPSSSLSGESFTVSFCESFRRFAQEIPSAPAVIVPRFLGDTIHYQRCTFRELDELVSKYERGLADLGLQPGDRVLMLVKPGVDFLALAYALVGRGAIPVFLDPGIGVEQLLRCARQCKPRVFIGTGLAHVLRLLKRKQFPSIEIAIIAADLPIPRCLTLRYLKGFSSRPLPAREARPDDTAFIAFTSGATGAPKGVVFSHRMVARQLEIFSKMFGCKAGNRDLPLLPVFSLFNTAVGVCSVFAPLNPARPLDLDPRRVVKIINDLGIHTSFGSPTLWRKIGEYCLRSKQRLSSLQKVWMAGAPVPKSTLEMMRSLIPEGIAYTPYGATECLPATCIAAEEILGEVEETALSGEQGTRVGKPIAGLDALVVQAEEGALSEEELHPCVAQEIGELLVSGDHVSIEYFENEKANTLGKVVAHGKRWHRMGDMAYVNEDGVIFFCGRKVHRVLLPERTYYSVPVESVFNSHEKVHRSALIPIREGQAAAVVVEPLPQFWPQTGEEEACFRAELKALGEKSRVTKDIDVFYFHKSFPVDARHNAKIFRDKLADWAARQPLPKGVISCAV